MERNYTAPQGTKERTFMRIWPIKYSPHVVRTIQRASLEDFRRENGCIFNHCPLQLCLERLHERLESLLELVVCGICQFPISLDRFQQGSFVGLHEVEEVLLKGLQ